MAYLLGIDVGTSGTKALICDEGGTILAGETVEHPSYHPKPLWSEQQPQDWWQTTVASVRKAVAQAGISGKEISAIGLSGQMHGAVFLDKHNEVLRPAILWNDQRTAEECDEITVRVGKQRLLELTCNPALTGFTAPKILWVRKHEPEIYDRAAKILLPKDFIRFRLTGVFATEVSDASGTLLLDVPNRRWSSEVLSALQIDESLLPECFESPEVSGKLTDTAAGEMGLAPETPVVGGGGDQAAGTASSNTVSSRPPSAPPESSSPSPTRWKPTPRAASTPSAMPSPASGTSWASCFPQAAPSSGIATTSPMLKSKRPKSAAATRTRCFARSPKKPSPAARAFSSYPISPANAHPTPTPTHAPDGSGSPHTTPSPTSSALFSKV